MEFPFQVGIDDQQSQKIKDHITEFYSGGYAPKVEHTFVNKDGEARKVLRFFLPKGCKTEDTLYSKEKRGTFYHTPLAKIDGELGSVLYEVMKDGKAVSSGSCTSWEWLDWADGADVDYTPNAAPEPNPQKDAFIKMGLKAQQAREDAGMKSDLAKDSSFTAVKTEGKPQLKKKKD